MAADNNTGRWTNGHCKILFFCILVLIICMGFAKNVLAADVLLPSLHIGIEKGGDPGDVSVLLQIVFLFTILALAPAILIMMTSFTRLVVVFSFLRHALGTQQTPSNQIIAGLALFLTFFIMTPVWQKINTQALQPYLAEDISQEVFLRVYRFLDGFKGQCRFSTWLYRITINVCFNAQRKRKEEPKVLIPSWEVANVGSNPGTPQLEDESFSPQKTLEKKELTTKIKSAIDSLPGVLKMTFILREFEDLSYRELAEVLRCSEGTIKSRLCRARETLRQKLEAYLSEGL